MTPLIYLKWTLGLAICGACVFLGYRLHGDPPPPAVQIETGTVQQTVVKQVVDTAKKHKVVVQEKKVDGSVTTTTTLDVEQEKVSHVQADKKVETEKVTVIPQPAPASPDYSVGLQWRPSLSPDYRPSSVQVGRRLIGNVWVTGEYEFGPKQAEIGVRVEF